MAPPTPGAGPEPRQQPDPVIGYALAPLAGSPLDRDPALLKAQLAEAFEEGLAQLRKDRGTVHLAEDTHQTIRLIYDVTTASDAIGDAFKALAKRGQGALAEELNEAVGEQDGIPNRSMDVPHNGATIRLLADYSTPKATIDLDDVLACFVIVMWQDWVRADRSPAGDPQRFAFECITRAITDLLPASAASPLPTAVEALAVELGNRGEDTLASVVRSAVRKHNRRFNKVKVEYKPGGKKA